MRLFHPTGYLLYHLRAFRQSQTRWLSFRRSLEMWLDQWQPSEEKLLLVGPSGGHCLDSRFLSRFKELSAIDPDHMAKWIFRRRYGRRVSWDTEDYFTPIAGADFDSARFKKVLNKYPDHAVLFCNFLGQLRYLNFNAATRESFKIWKQEIYVLLGERSWASFHDRVSGEICPEISGERQTANDLVSDAELLQNFYGSDYAQRIELLDHLTGDFFPGHPRQFMTWELTPGVFHVIEAVSHVAVKKTYPQCVDK